MKVGYARVSTKEQHLQMQEEALKSAGCDEIYTDIASGTKAGRPGLDKALAYAREGDMLVVWKLDRLGRSIQHLIQTVALLKERKIAFKSLQDAVYTIRTFVRQCSHDREHSLFTSTHQGAN